MAASHLFSNKKNSKDPQHMNFGKRTGAGPWWALPWALPWALGPPLGPPGPSLGPGGALVGPCGDRALRGPWALVGLPLGPPGALRGLGPVGAPTNT